MIRSHASGVTDAADSAGGEQRRCGRIRCTSPVRCSNGYVVDLSASGARIEWLRSLNRKPGEMIRVTIEGVNENITLDARIVWTRRVGWRRHQLGVEFLDVTGEQRKGLGMLVRHLLVMNDEG